MRFCVECEHYKIVWYGFLLCRKECTHENNTNLSLVNGKKLYDYGFDYLRKYEDKCGKEGKWFKRK